VTSHKHIWATDKMRDRCKKCGTWRRVHVKCNIPGCKEKKVNVVMCKCTLKGLK
jgi:hypothetical protein